MRLHLIRHGQTDWNAEQRCQGQSDSQLDDTGKAQADACRTVVEQLGIDTLYASSSLRTQQTAEILNKEMALDIQLRDDLKEIKLGVWETRLWSEICLQEPDAAEAFQKRPEEFSIEGGETYQQLRERGRTALENIIDTATGKEILIVSHGALIQATLSSYANIDLTRLREVPRLENCSRSVLEVKADGSRRIVTIADRPFADTAWFSPT